MMMLGRGCTALQHRNYRLFWWGQLISLIGTWMQTTAQAWLVLQLTGSAADLGIVTALHSLPVLFIGFFGGVIADWLPKRRLLIITQTAQMLLALILGVLVSTHTVQMWHLYLLATLLGITNAFDMPTRQAFVMEMVGREELLLATATLAGMSGWINAHRRSPGYRLVDQPAAIPVTAELPAGAARGPARALRESTAA